MARKSGLTTRNKKIVPIADSAAAQPISAASELPNPVASPIAATTAPVNLDDEIRRRAYELYLQRNGAAGDPNRDWLVAEREVRARHAAAGQST